MSNKKNILKNRVIVENFFSWIKKKNRLNIRIDKKIETFTNFVYLGAIKIIDTKIKNGKIIIPN